MKSISLNKKGIIEYQQNRHPYLMIDYATEIVPGVSSKGYKKLKSNEWFFKVHWPGDPNMPGLLQVESMVQMCAMSLLTMHLQEKFQDIDGGVQMEITMHGGIRPLTLEQISISVLDNIIRFREYMLLMLIYPSQHGLWMQV